ncbi:hypothetical protein [Leptospira noguchii]|nr:hypothetical protein [Leptospira noguchii]
MNELKHNALYGSRGKTQQNAFYESVNSAKRFLRKRFRIKLLIF